MPRDRREYQPVANGMSTDHPIPDLPFVDDAHIPVQDGPAVERVGRMAGRGMWGRYDDCDLGGRGWVAFTTDPVRTDLAWLVRWDPEHGRSVVLYSNAAVSGLHGAYMETALLYRAGDYWWDGATWYRPRQVWDRARERFLERPVPAATTITAADLLRTGGDARRAGVLTIDQVDPAAAPLPRWLDHLAYWAEHRTSTHPLNRCVVKLTAPELTGDALVGATEMAEIAEVAPGTLRAYLSRGQNDVPAPQATINGRPVWARPVAEEWAERRRSDPQELAAVLAGPQGAGTPPPGIAAAWDRYTQIFFAHLWDHPGLRRRWALRWRTEQAVHEVAHTLAWDAAGELTNLPHDDLANTIAHAWVQQLRAGLHGKPVSQIGRFIGVDPAIARMLDWLLAHDPRAGLNAITRLAGDAERTLRLPRDVVRESLLTALALDGTVDDEPLQTVIDRLLPLEPTTTTRN